MNEEKNYEEEKINVLEAGTVVRRPVPVVRNALDSEFYHHFIYSISFSVKYHHQCYFLCVIFVQSEIIYIQMHRDVVDVFDFFLFCFSLRWSEVFWTAEKNAHTKFIFYKFLVEQTNKYQWKFGSDRTLTIETKCIRWCSIRSAQTKNVLLIFYQRSII